MQPEPHTIKTVDYRGRTYSAFFPRRDSGTGPGWYVFGCGAEYGGTLRMLCARPDVAARRHPHYNVLVRRGFRTMREAAAVAAAMNAESGR